MDSQVLESTLLECGNDIDIAIKRLEQLCLGPPEEKLAGVEQGAISAAGHDVAAADRHSLAVDGAVWVDLFVGEMLSAISLDDAKLRAKMLLDNLEKSITERAGEEVKRNFYMENISLKEQIGVLTRQNSILKHAVVIQHERQKKWKERDHEMQQLKQLISQYQEQVRTLEKNNYSLAMHLKQAQKSNSIVVPLHPDVF